jgi:hypothetical protein
VTLEDRLLAVVQAIGADIKLLARRKLTINAQTGNYTYVLADAGLDKLTTHSAAGAITATIPPNVFAVGDVINGATNGAGQCTVTQGAGVTFQGGAYKSSRRGSYWTAVCVASNEFLVNGDLTT